MEKGIVIPAVELNDLWFGWLGGGRLDVMGIHSGGGEKAAERMNYTIDYVKSQAGQEYLDYWRRLGSKIEVEGHAASWLMQDAGLKSHPEWARIDENGNRDFSMNFCLSNPEALAAVSDSAEKLAEVLPADTGKYYLWQDDCVQSRRCHCAQCSALSESDQMLRFANAVLKGLRRKNPDAKLSYLAYCETLALPTKVEPEPGIFLEYAPYLRDFNRSAADPTSEVNMEHKRKMEDLLRFFGTKDAAVLEYWLDDGLFSKYKRPAIRLPYSPELVRRDIAFYEEAGFGKITTFSGFFDAEYVSRYGDPPVADYIRAFSE